jgi:hypothetical protein
LLLLLFPYQLTLLLWLLRLLLLWRRLHIQHLLLLLLLLRRLHDRHLLLLLSHKQLLQLLQLQLLQLLRHKQLLLLVLIPLSLHLLQSKCLLKLLSSTHAQHLNPVHRTHRLTAIVRVKRQQQVAHAAALRQRERLRTAFVFRSEAAQ